MDFLSQEQWSALPATDPMRVQYKTYAAYFQAKQTELNDALTANASKVSNVGAQISGIEGVAKGVVEDAGNVGDLAVGSTGALAAAGFGLTTALVKAHPELLPVWEAFKQNNVTLATQLLTATEFFKNTSSTAMQRAAKKSGQPGVYQQELTKFTDDLKKHYKTQGLTVSDADVLSAAQKAFDLGLAATDQQTFDLIDGFISGFTGGGTAAETGSSLKSYAASMGVSYDQSWFDNAEKSVATGATDETFWKTKIKDLAKSQYLGFSDQIDAGMTMENIASPFISKMASILEIDPYAINLSDPLISQALNSKDAKNNPSAMSLWQFEQTLKNDPRWNYTANARAATDNAARSVLRDFGLAW